jgi:hypothetical protein
VIGGDHLVRHDLAGVREVEVRRAGQRLPRRRHREEPGPRASTPVRLTTAAEPISDPSPGIKPSTIQPGHSLPIVPGSRVSRMRTGSIGTNNPTSVWVRCRPAFVK